MPEKTYFLVNLAYRHPGQTYDSGWSGECFTLEGARKVLPESINYFSSIGAIITEAEVVELCDKCDGTGEIYRSGIRNPLEGKYQRCPECRGKDSKVVRETWVNIPYEFRAQIEVPQPKDYNV